MISAQILREYHTYFLDGAANKNALDQAASLAEASQMYALKIEALRVRSLIEDPSPRGSAITKAEALADRLNYRSLHRIYPSKRERGAGLSSRA